MLSLLFSFALANPIDFNVFSFYDLKGDCNDIEARLGQCVEYVHYLNVQELPPSGKEAHSLGYFTLWEDLQFAVDQGAWKEILGEKTLPDLESQWGTRRFGKTLYSVPNDSRWRLSHETSRDLFVPLRIAPLAESKMLLFQGRFAKNLGYREQPHPYDIMAADSENSGPFFEQHYPFEPKMLEEKKASPLYRYQNPIMVKRAPVKQVIRSKEDIVFTKDIALTDIMTQSEEKAQSEFEFLSDAISSLIVRYAASEYTTNHVQILSSLALMNRPPQGEKIKAEVGTMQLNIAAKGQSDEEGPQAVSYFHSNDGLKLNLNQLPDRVLDKWIKQLEGEKRPDEATIQEILRNSQIQVREEALSLLVDLDYKDIWLKAHIKPNKDYWKEIRKLNIAYLKWLLDHMQDQQDKGMQTIYIVYDHFNDKLGAELNKKSGSSQSPKDVVDLTASIWEEILMEHGLKATYLAQKTNRVSPVAICTTQTKDIESAFAEPVVKPIQVKMVLVAPRGLDDPNEVLGWNMGQVDFIMLDDPYKNRPKLKPIIDLPGNRSLYEVSWRLWSGWHVLWELYNTEIGGFELRAKTTALCDDVYFTPEHLAPTLLRASLLEGNFYPTTPISKMSLAKNLGAFQQNQAEAEAVASPMTEIKDIILKRLAKNAADDTLLIALETDSNSRDGMGNLNGSSPYERVHHKGFWQNGWIRYLSADGSQSPLITPFKQALQEEDSTTLLPTWKREENADWYINLAFGSRGLSQSRIASLTETTRCQVGQDCFQHQLEIGFENVNWISAATTTPISRFFPIPKGRLGWDISLHPGVRAYGAPWGSPNIYDVNVTGGFGFRWMLYPTPVGLWSGGTNVWGPSAFGKKGNYSRVQLGTRLIVDSTVYSTAEQSDMLPDVGAELWLGFASGSVQRPYHPKLYWTPYVRGYADLFGETPTFGARLGLRVSYRLQAEPKDFVSAVESIQK
ncbi:MAG: hypothetical protein VX278_11335 [Myxococcota bacterium]|nr:hypothetical protein [Myxococcota bacterium]